MLLWRLLAPVILCDKSISIPQVTIAGGLFFLFLCYGFIAHASESGKAVLLDIKGAIGPATTDYVSRGIEKAIEGQAKIVILRMDTPGGLDYSMRSINKTILASTVPVVSFVAPAGARAASAGTYILYASHVAAMAPATVLGAATPVKLGGLPGLTDDEPDKPKDAEKKDNGSNDKADKSAEKVPKSTMDSKIVNDAAAYIKGLANRHGRNAEWAERAVRKAVSLTAKEAKENNVIDIIATDVPDLLHQLDGYPVRLEGSELTLSTKSLVVEAYEPDWRSRLLSVITDPNVAYILMLIGIYGLIFELSNPGSVLPGVAGAISLLLALYAFQVLPINYAGLGLMILGIAFMIAEAFLPSFGALGLGGVIAFVVGSIILMGEDQLSISLPLIGGTALVSAGFFLWVISRLIGMRKKAVVSGAEQMVGLIGYALNDFRADGKVRVHSETWKARSKAAIQKSQRIRVISMDGLILTVEPTGKPSELEDLSEGKQG
jgi:membrane-bound serine protease (ClpP class)